MLNDDTDIDAALAYYWAVNHGIMPRQITEMGAREKALLYCIAKKEVQARENALKD